jgi:hypothetical protein
VKPILKLRAGFFAEIDLNNNKSIFQKMTDINFDLPKNLMTTELLNNVIYISITHREVEKKKSNGDPYKVIQPYVVIRAVNTRVITNLMEIIIAYDIFKRSNINNFKLKMYTYYIEQRDEKALRVLDATVNVNKTYDNIFLSETNTNIIKKSMKYFNTNCDQILSEGSPHKLTYLLFGEPGCGKSSLIFAAANENKKNIYAFNLEEFNNTKLINVINKISNAIVVFEDFDAYEFTHNREVVKQKKDLRKMDTDVSDYRDKDTVTLDTLLQILDAYLYLKDCIIFITTNKKELFDPALIRPGRIDYEIEFKLADAHQFDNIFKFYIGSDYRTFEPIFVFPENIFSTSCLINIIIVPNRSTPEKIFDAIRTHHPSTPKPQPAVPLMIELLDVNKSENLTWQHVLPNPLVATSTSTLLPSSVSNTMPNQTSEDIPGLEPLEPFDTESK